jgi:hypothetical protein
VTAKCTFVREQSADIRIYSVGGQNFRKYFNLWERLGGAWPNCYWVIQSKYATLGWGVRDQIDQYSYWWKYATLGTKRCVSGFKNSRKKSVVVTFFGSTDYTLRRSCYLSHFGDSRWWMAIFFVSSHHSKQIGSFGDWIPSNCRLPKCSALLHKYREKHWVQMNGEWQTVDQRVWTIWINSGSVQARVSKVSLYGETIVRM